ncbi:MAG: hypothetical protein V3V98_01165 [Thermoplasmata archaeon]
MARRKKSIRKRTVSGGGRTAHCRPYRMRVSLDYCNNCEDCIPIELRKKKT